jgi:hypothetical protein
VPRHLLVINGDAAQKNAPEISADDLTLYYSSGPLEVAYASRPDVRASRSQFVREIDEVNAPPTDGGPTLTPDGLELFFDTYRNGNAAVFRASRASTPDAFSAPVEVTELTAGPRRHRRPARLRSAPTARRSTTSSIPVSSTSTPATAQLRL